MQAVSALVWRCAAAASTDRLRCAARDVPGWRAESDNWCGLRPIDPVLGDAGRNADQRRGWAQGAAGDGPAGDRGAGAVGGDTADAIVPRYARAGVLQQCGHQGSVDLQAIVAAGRGDVP